MAKKVLNLDEVLTTDPRELVLNGQTYTINEMSVEDYVEVTKTAEKLGEGASVELQMNETARMIARQVPGLTQQQLMKLPVEKLYAIAEFVRGVDPEQILKKASGEAPEQKKAEEGNVKAA